MPVTLVETMQEALGIARRMASVEAEIKEVDSAYDAEVAELEERRREALKPLEARYSELADAFRTKQAEMGAPVTGRLREYQPGPRPGRRPGYGNRPGDAEPPFRVVLSALEQLGGRGNARAIAEHLGIPTSNIVNVLSEMRTANLVRGIGQGRYRDYEIA